MYDLLVIGGGAAGFFGAISAADHADRKLKIAILEQSKRVLQKVRISGGGRCNVTHAQFDPKELVKAYPRGKKELLGPFTKFAPGDTMAWFEERGVPLKIEEDNRVFPESDSSQSIIDTLVSGAKKHQIEIRTLHKVTNIHANADSSFTVQFQKENSLSAKHLLVATGSGPKGYAWMERLSIKLIDRVPSLFSFNVLDSKLHELQGLSVPLAHVQLENGKSTTGSLLITHWGFSGPAVLRLSAEAAIELHQCDYKASYLIKRAGLDVDRKWASITKIELTKLSSVLSADKYELNGQTRFKEEFVTAGGVELSMIDFRSFQVVSRPGLYIAGELLNIDGITGGFNFQAAWTGGFLAGRAIARQLNA